MEISLSVSNQVKISFGSHRTQAPRGIRFLGSIKSLYEADQSCQSVGCVT